MNHLRPHKPLSPWLIVLLCLTSVTVALSVLGCDDPECQTPGEYRFQTVHAANPQNPYSSVIFDEINRTSVTLDYEEGLEECPEDPVIMITARDAASGCVIMAKAESWPALEYEGETAPVTFYLSSKGCSAPVEGSVPVIVNLHRASYWD